MKISVKILLPTALLLLLAVSTVSFIGYTNISEEINTTMTVATESVLNDLTKQINSIDSEAEILKASLNKNYLRIARSIAAIIAQNPQIVETESMIDLAEQIGVSEIHIVNGEGVLYAGSVPGFFGFDFDTSDQTRPFLAMIEDKNFELAQEPSIRAVDGVLFQYIGVPLISEDGLVQIGVEPRELQNLLENSSLQNLLENYSYKSGSYAYVISPETKTSIAHVIPDRIGTDMTQFDFARKIIEKKNGSFTYTFNEEEVFTSFKTTPKGIIISAMPTKAYRDKLNTILFSFIITSVLSLVVLTLLMFLLIRIIISPIGLISGYLESIASGYLNVKINPQLINKKDEVGILSRSLSNMLTNLKEIVQDVRKATDYLNNSSSQLNDSSQQLSSGAVQQAASAEEVSSSMEEMRSNISQSADNSQQTETIAKKAAGAAIQSGKTVNEAMDAMVQIATKINIIEEISRRTNLLALNAAIEAARAGEHGKGFAVVAAEVRKLAERSQAAAGEITTLASKTVTLSESSSKDLNDLVPEIQKTAELIQEISVASSEQLTGVDQITSAILQLDQIIQNNASSAEQLAATSEVLSAQAQNLDNTMEFFKINDQDLLTD